MKQVSNGEDAEESEDAEDSEDAENSEDAEESEDAEDSKDAEDSEDAENSEDAEDSAGSSVKVKNPSKRGRPKEDSEDAEDSAGSSVEEKKEKPKKRGRPKKEDSEDSEDSEDVKPKKRGRPNKSSQSPLTNKRKIVNGGGRSVEDAKKKSKKKQASSESSDNEDKSDDMEVPKKKSRIKKVASESSGNEDEADNDVPKKKSKKKKVSSESSGNEDESDDEVSKKKKTKKKRFASESSESEDESDREVPKKKSKKKAAVKASKKKITKKKASSGSSEDSDKSDSEYDSKPAKKTIRKKLDKKLPPMKTKQKKKVVKKKKLDSDEDSGTADDDDDGDSSDGEDAKRYKNLKLDPSDVGEKKSSRPIAEKTYAEDDEYHSSDVQSGDEMREVVQQQESIEVVLDHRTGKVGATGESTLFWTVKKEGDPEETLETEETEMQFLIKWSGRSHINNTWESEAELEEMNLPKGSLRKLLNYQSKLSDFNVWKSRAHAEDVEFQEIDIEMNRQLLATHVQVERIFGQRENTAGGLDYYVKWTNLPYSEATWEEEGVVSGHYSQELDTFTARMEAGTNPRPYTKAMKLKDREKKFVPLKEQPDYLGDDKLRLRDYQMDGVNFMLNAWSKGHSTILADEMGLGKTIQSITFFRYLFHNFSFKGPMLVCVPLSTIGSWQKEFATWAPNINMVSYVGENTSRKIIRKFECKNDKGDLTFNVLLTNYEMVNKDSSFFQGISWSNIVVDEAHRLKNHESSLFKVLMGIKSHHRLLLTGTPLQNSLKELWCLLKYLQLPDFDMREWETFEDEFGTKEDKASGYVKLHSLLKPFIIRRLKKDVEKSLPQKVEQILRVDMTKRQKNIYKLVLTKNYDALSRGKNQVSLMNIMMHLRKACNHAELVGDMDEDEYATDPTERLHQLTYGSGKLVLLDKLLTRFRENGDRVLVFSQMVMMLNILDEFLTLRRYPFQRLDGSVSNDKRKQSIAQFNDPKSRDFCFLLSTKAGGLGINLQTANRVIIFDSDWNPQNDLQAIARAHRIGQKEEVKIFRLVSSSSVDEDVIHRAKNKMVLDHLVIQTMDTTGKTVVSGAVAAKKAEKAFDKAQLNMILKFGAQDLFATNDMEDQEKELDLDKILQSAETREDDEAPQSEANKELLGAFKCTNIAFEEEESPIKGKKEKKGKKKEAGIDWSDIIPKTLVDEEKAKKAEAEKEKEKENGGMYSDPEALFNPVVQKSKKLVKKSKFDRFASSEDDSDMSDGEKERRKEEKRKKKEEEDEEGEKMMELKREKAAEREAKKQENIAKKSVICLECQKPYVDRRNLQIHMKKSHAAVYENWSFSAANVMDGPLKDSLLEALKAKEEGGAPKGRAKGSNTKKNLICADCKKGFVDKKGLWKHIAKAHPGGAEEDISAGGLEKKEVEDDDDDEESVKDVEDKENSTNGVVKGTKKVYGEKSVICLECKKRFVDKKGLKKHMKKAHTTEGWSFGPDNILAAKESKKLQEVDEEDEEAGEGDAPIDEVDKEDSKEAMKETEEVKEDSDDENKDSDDENKDSDDENKDSDDAKEDSDDEKEDSDGEA